MSIPRCSDEFFTAYVECALWSSTDEDGEPLDRFDVDAITKASLRTMRAECDDFVGYCQRIGEPFNESDALAVHDCWLTRNGHGAGFWDRGLPNGEALTKAAKTFGSAYLYINRRSIHLLA